MLFKYSKQYANKYLIILYASSLTLKIVVSPVINREHFLQIIETTFFSLDSKKLRKATDIFI